MKLESDKFDARRPLPSSVVTLERLTRAEAALVRNMRARANETFRQQEEALAGEPEGAAKTLSGLRTRHADICAGLNSDYVFHVARFFFLLRVLGCDGEAQMAAFIKSHNERLAAFKLEDASRSRSPSELKKADFSNRRKAEVLDTLRDRERLALATGEIADFLFDHGSRKRINEAVNVLIGAGLLIPLSETEKQLLPRPSRLLVQTDNYLEACYERFLLAIEGGSDTAAGDGVARQ